MLRKRALLKILVALTLTLGILLALGLTVHAAEYDLWITEIQVTDENKADILGDGVFSFDSDRKTLSVNGDCKSGSAYNAYEIEFGGVTIIKSDIDGLTIKVVSDSKLSKSYSSKNTIELGGDTTIKGPGELTVFCGSFFKCYDIVSAIKLLNDASLTLDHSKLKVDADVGICDGSSLKIIDSDVEISASYSHWPNPIVIPNGIFFNFKDGITLKGSQFVSPASAVIKNGTVYPDSETDELLQGEVVIKRITHKVNADALNVRDGAGSEYSRIGGLTRDKEVVVLETQGEWSKIPYGSDYGWVQSKYLSPVEEETNTVTFDANGGSGTMPDMTVKAGEKLTLPECSFTPPEGKVFDRWIAGKPGEQVDVGGDSIIRAFWKDAIKPHSLPNPFSDVYETDDYYDAVLWAFHREPQVTNGMDETHFGPQLTVTRGQAVTFLWRAMGCPKPVSDAHGFWDISSSDYYFEPVLWAVENGITKGTAPHYFSPDDTLSTQHMITFLYRTKNPGLDGWDGEAQVWAETGYGPNRPFGVSTSVNNTTPCPRCYVVQFLYSSGAEG